MQGIPEDNKKLRAILDLLNYSKSKKCYDNYSKQENTMTEEIFKAQAAELEQQHEELKTKLSTLEADFQAKAQKEHQAEVEKLTKSVAELQTQIESQNTLVTEITSKDMRAEY